MQLSDFNFELPQELIALRPVTPRGDAKLLVGTSAGIEDAHVLSLIHI